MNALILQSFKEAWIAPEDLSIADWGKKHVDLGQAGAVPGFFDVGRSKYMVAAFDDLKDPTCKEVIAVWAIGIGKTVMTEVYVPWLICNSHNNILHVHQTLETAKEFADSRINPVLDRIPEVKALLPNDKKKARKKLDINFGHLNYFIRSATKNSLQGKPCRYLIGDEIWCWKDKTLLGYFKARASRFEHNKKIFIVSQAGEVGDVLDSEVAKANQYAWGYHCPSCGKIQEYHWNYKRKDETRGGVYFDTSFKLSDGRHDYDRCAATVKFVCIHCNHSILPTLENRRAMNDNGDYILTKDNGNPSVRARFVPAMACIDIPLELLVVEYLQGKDASKRGDRTEHKRFTQQRLAVAWQEGFDYDIIKASIEQFDINAQFGNRFMGIDVQRDCFYYVVIAIGPSGEVRRLSYGKALTYEDLRDIQTKFQIPNIRVGIDCGFNEPDIAQKIAKLAIPVKNNQGSYWQTWLMFKGDGGLEWTHHDERTGAKSFKPYSKHQLINYLLGKPATGEPLKHVWRYLWSNRRIKDMVVNIRDGRSGKLVCDTDDQDWNESMNSELLGGDPKKPHIYSPVTPNNPKNHYWDCLCIAVCLSLMQNCLTVKL